MLVKDDRSPAVVVFLAGERSLVELAIDNARRVYAGRRLIFVCERAHRAWFHQMIGERIFVVEQPFNPFGRIAAELRKSLDANCVEACALVVADVGLGSFRFRVLALRLATARFHLLLGTPPVSKQFGRFSFALLAGTAFILGCFRKIKREILGVRKLHGWLSTLREVVLTRAVEVQRSNVVRGRANFNLNRAIVPLGIRCLDKRYRRFFQHLFSEQWERWFDSTAFSANSIMLVIGSLGPGGSERQAVTTALGLVSRGYSDLSLLCTCYNNEVDRFYAPLLEGTPVSVSGVSEGLEFTRNSSKHINEMAWQGLNFLLERVPEELKDITWYAREFLARKPGIVHTWLDYTNAKAAVAAAIVGVPRIIVSTRSVAPNHFAFFQPYMREAYRALAKRQGVCLLNNSEAGARNYEQWLGLSRGTFKIVRNGFDFSGVGAAEKVEPARALRLRLGVPLDVPVLGSVMRFSEEKRPLLWVDVAARVSKRRPDAKFLLIGDGPLWEETCRHAATLGLADRILMPGYEKHSAAAIAAMDVFMLTSRVEGLPNVLIEAQALGVPVVTTDVGGAVETLVHGRTGYSVSPASPELLSKTVLQILDDIAWREAARQTAPIFVRHCFSMAQMMERTLDAYFARGDFAERSTVELTEQQTLEALS